MAHLYCKICFSLKIFAFEGVKSYLDMLLYDRNIIVPSRKSSEFFGNLRKMSEKCSETFALPSEKFWKIFGNLRKLVGNLRKIFKNVVISMFK